MIYFIIFKIKIYRKIHKTLTVKTTYYSLDVIHLVFLYLGRRGFLSWLPKCRVPQASSDSQGRLSRTRGHHGKGAHSPDPRRWGGYPIPDVQTQAPTLRSSLFPPKVATFSLDLTPTTKCPQLREFRGRQIACDIREQKIAHKE
jgi:hypothetical protein